MDLRSIPMFTLISSSISKIEEHRKDYYTVNDEINQLTLQINPEAVLQNNSLFAFDDLYYHVLSVYEEVVQRGENPNDDEDTSNGGFRSEGQNKTELLTFLQDYVKVLETTQHSSSTSNASSSRSSQSMATRFEKGPSNNKQTRSALTVQHKNSAPTFECLCCSATQHSIYKCPTYQAMNVHARVQCLSKSSCQVCGLRHHTTVHTEKSNESPKPTTLAKSNTGSSASVSQANTSVHVGQNQGQLYIMLGTCMVRAYDAFGSPQYLRALIDGGSQDCFITTACAKKLGLPIRRSKLKVTGIGGNSVPIEGSTHCAIQPCDASEPVFHIHPLVMEKVTTEMPSMAIPSKVKERFKHLMLADGNFDIPSDIDLIIGAEFCADVFEGDKIKLEPGLPVALKSVFGWVITGPIEISYCVSPSTASSLFTTTVHLDDVVKRFWEVEEPPHTPLCSLRTQIVNGCIPN
ncbi:putative peptidase (DUF1758) domain-containing protein [Phthorimaea operculella]|nr:putative peptidase (DUF1758) domain-containing protein [Phthorimaea operculella]